MEQVTTAPRVMPRPLAGDHAGGTRHGLKKVLGVAAWQRLPEAVRERFSEDSPDATYAGAYEIVRASLFGRLIAWIAVLFGTPVAPRVGTNVAACVMVRAHGAGVDWIRAYLWEDGRTHVVKSTKLVTPDGRLIEKLPAGLCMPLESYEERGVLHFVSRGYYIDPGLGMKLWLPEFLTPGVTHVEHIDLGHGWFRFTMAVTHPWFGEVYFQTGRFCATEVLE